MFSTNCTTKRERERQTDSQNNVYVMFVQAACASFSLSLKVLARKSSQESTMHDPDTHRQWRLGRLWPRRRWCWHREGVHFVVFSIVLHNLYLLVFVEIVAVLAIRKITYMSLVEMFPRRIFPEFPLQLKMPIQWLFIILAWNRPQSGSLGAWSFTRDQRPIVSAHSHKHKAQIHTQTQTQRRTDAETNTETLRHRQKHSDMKTRKKTRTQ